jgi:hypothetical protein
MANIKPWSELDMSDKSSEKKVSVLVEAQSLIRSLAEPAPAADKVKAAIRRAHRKLPTWTPNRVRDVWNADRRISIRGAEIDELRAAVAARKREEKAASNELREFRERLARLEAALLSTDKDFHRETLTALREQAGGPRRNGSALDSGE